MPNRFEITLTLTVNQDMVPGWGHNAGSWRDLFTAAVLRQSHYAPAVSDARARYISPDGTPLIEAASVAELDALLDTLTYIGLPEGTVAAYHTSLGDEGLRYWFILPDGKRVTCDYAVPPNLNLAGTFDYLTTLQPAPFEE